MGVLAAAGVGGLAAWALVRSRLVTVALGLAIGVGLAVATDIEIMADGPSPPDRQVPSDQNAEPQDEEVWPIVDSAASGPRRWWEARPGGCRPRARDRDDVERVDDLTAHIEWRRFRPSPPATRPRGWWTRAATHSCDTRRLLVLLGGPCRGLLIEEQGRAVGCTGTEIVASVEGTESPPD